MKRLLLLLSILVFPLLGQTATPPTAGDGSVGDPWQLASLKNLYWLTQNSSEWDMYFILMVDLDATATATWDGGQGLSPIGNQDEPFSGNFDGNGKTISNLSIDRSSTANIGLFGYTENATISDLHLLDFAISGGNYTGGLVGNASTGSNISDCSASGEVTGLYFVGSVTGGCDATINGSYGSGIVNGVYYLGGFTGMAIGTISNSYANSQVNGDNYIGGFVGQFRSGLITNCYSTGKVPGIGSRIGGFVGFKFGASTATACFWDTETSGTTSSAAGTGKTTAQMKQQVTYSGWDFGATWVIVENLSYPKLQWQGSSGGPPQVTTTAAQNIAATSVQLRGEVNPSGTATEYFFQWGSTSGSYSDSSAKANIGNGTVTLALFYDASGLNADTDYFFRIVAENTEGRTYGDERSFRSLPDAITPVGDGSVGSPFLIASKENLYWLSQNSGQWSKHFLQTADIDISASANWADGAGFLPIGNSTTKFTGSYNGSHYEITGLTIDRGTTYNGLFGYVDGASLDSIVVVDAMVSSGLNYAGSVAAYLTNGASVSDCYGDGIVNGTGYSGGLVGNVGFGCLLTRSSFSGDVSGSSIQIGGLAGRNQGTVSLCYSTGTVFGSTAGGLIGNNNGTIENAFSYADVEGTSSAGGLTSNSTSAISNCFSTGRVEGLGDLGGLMESNSGSVTNSYWNTESSGLLFSAAGTAKTTAELQLQATYSGWNFTTVWSIDEGVSFASLQWQSLNADAPDVNIVEVNDLTPTTVQLNGSVVPNGAATTYYFKYGTTSGVYPNETAVMAAGSGFAAVPVAADLNGLVANKTYYYLLFAENSNGTVNSEENSFTTRPSSNAPAGSGTGGDPYQISTLAHLAWMGWNSTAWDKDYILLNDIDAAATEDWDDGKGFLVIGNTNIKFTGTFNGRGHSIRNLVINRPDELNIGFFGYLNNADIDSLKLTNVDVTGYDNVGALSGYVGVSASINACMAEGSVLGTHYFIGGLTGYNSGATISNCYSDGSVESLARRYVGGLSGVNDNSTITNSYSMSDVLSGSVTIGGLVGDNTNGSTVTLSFSSGLVEGSHTTIGGLIGDNDATVTNSYWDTETSGQSSSDGGTSKTTAQMKMQTTFSGWDFTPLTGDWFIDEGVSYPLLQWDVPQSAGAPIVTTLGSDSLTYNSAVVSALINGNLSATTYYFEYGTVSGLYTQSTSSMPLSTTYSDEEVEAKFTGLIATTTYYFRVVATNAIETSYGNELSFSTLFGPVAPTSGDGSPATPYQIETVNQLYWLSLNDSEWAKAFVLVNDIDAAVTSSLDNEKGFAPIGNASVSFSGNFDGNSKLISNLYINRPEANYGGLFGYLSGASISDLGLKDLSINTAQYTGGLAGFTTDASSISGCFTAGSISGTINVGGIIGWLDGSSSLLNCYSSASVNGTTAVGGLIGYNINGSVSDCFSYGNVSGSGYQGGLIGRDFAGSVSSSYWDTQTSTQTSSAGGTGKTTAQMKTAATFAGWDLSGTWRLAENQSYPYFGWEKLTSDLTLTVAGSGSQSLPVGNRSGIDQIDFSNVTTPGAIAIQYYEDIPVAPSGIAGTISQYRWIIEPGDLVIDEAAGYSIRFNLADLYGFGGINEYTGADPNVSDIRLYKRDTPGSGAFAVVPGFLEYYNNGTIGDQRDDYVITPLITDGFSEFVFATEGDHPLPVELSTFRATGKDRQVELFWKTASELLNSGFNVYRSDSEEGEYQEISSYRYNEDLEGLGTSAHGQDYRFTDNDFRLLNDATYYYKIADVDVNGVVTMHGPVTATPTASEGDEQVARLFKLYPNYPNPFNPTTTIVVDLEEFTDEALIEVYDITGRLVKTLYNGPINQYRIMVEWDGTNNAGNTLSTGMYFYRYRSANRDIMRKMILMK
jgi:hypothetical protein